MRASALPLFKMKRQEGQLKRILIISAALALVVQAAFAQEETARSAPKAHKKPAIHRVVTKPRNVRAVLSPNDFPITLTAYDRPTKEADASGTVMEISKNGYKSFKSEALYTKDLDGEQIASIVSWQNTERTHFGFLVLTTPSAGNLYSVMFFLYHDGKLTMPIDEIATGYPVVPSIRKSDKTGQIVIAFDDGNTAATNDQKKTVVYYTWSDYSKKFLKSVHEVAAESVSRERPKPRGKKILKTEAASGQ